MPIPKIIHQLWISPNRDSPPKDIRKNIKSWEETHPDFIQIIWTPERLEKMLESFHGLNVWKYIQQCKFPAMQSDLIRLALVYEHGGFWNDLKNHALRPFLYDFLDFDIPLLIEHWPTDNPNPPNPHLANGFFGAPANNKFLWKCLETACENIKSRKNESVYSLTGGGVMIHVIYKNLKKETPQDYHLLSYSDIWGITIQRQGGSYNDGGLHWSVRQKNESCFI